MSKIAIQMERKIDSALICFFPFEVMGFPFLPHSAVSTERSMAFTSGVSRYAVTIP